jgi:hypothetical protein
VLAAHSSVRSEVVPRREPRPEPEQLLLFAAGEVPALEPAPPPSRHPWDWLLRRVFAVDVSVCEARMRIVEIASSQADIARVLAPGARGPPPARPPRPARPGQLSLAFG